MSQSMKSHNSSSTLPLLTTSLQLWTCRTDRPQTADSHYASLPGNVYHATPTWNTKINICEISSVYVFLISHLHMKQCIDLYKENMSPFSFPWSTQIQEPLTSWSFCYYHFCLFDFTVNLRTHSYQPLVCCDKSPVTENAWLPL